MKKFVLSTIIMCATLGVSAQEGLHVRSYWSNYIIPIEEIDSITIGTLDTLSNADKLPALMASDQSISLFYEALSLTHMVDSLNVSYYDYTYVGPTDDESKYAFDYRNRLEMDSGESSSHSCRPVFHRICRFTAFVEPNSVYARYGINNIEDLKAYAAKIYDEVYPEDATISDPTDRRNSLNRFVSYHLLDRFADSQNLVAATMKDFEGNGILGCFKSNIRDAYDCYETMMPYSLMKVSYGMKTGYVHRINRKYGWYNGDEEYKIIGAPLITEKCDNYAKNGVYHCINDIISYDKQTQEIVFNERLTFDISTLSPEFANNDIRHKVGQTTLIPSRSIKNINFETGNLVYEPGHANFWCYQTDELILFPPYDAEGITIKLPPMPAGTYELCFSMVPMRHRGVLQFYLDDQPCGDPVDYSVDIIAEGWFSDDELADDEIIAQENEFRSKGWMKGLNDYACGVSGNQIMRSLSVTLRRIIGSFYTDGKSDHYLRIQPISDATKEIMLDYIQLTPRAIYEKELTYPYE